MSNQANQNDKNLITTVNGLEVVDSLEAPARDEKTSVLEKEYRSKVQQTPITHTLVEEKFVYRDIPIKKEKVVKEAVVNTLHRKIEIPKPYYDVEPVEVLQKHIVDKVEEVYEDIERQRIVEKPRIIFQERIIPIPKRKVEEITKKIPKDLYDSIIGSQFDKLEANTKNEEMANELVKIAEDDLKASMQNMFLNGVKGLLNEAETIENQEKHRHIPKPMEIPMIYYKPNPVERIVNRNVPVPVELNVVQEFKCPTLVPVWEEKPVPVHYTRIIEKPVPADAFQNKTLMKMYLQQTKDLDAEAEANWNNNQCSFVSFCSNKSSKYPIRYKLTEEECLACGLTLENYEKLNTLSSYDWNQYQTYNATVSANLLTSKRSMAKNKGEDSLINEDKKVIFNTAS